MGEVAQVTPVLPTLRANAPSAGLSLTARSGEEFPAHTASRAGTLLNLESHEGNVGISMSGPHSAEVRKQVHEVSQTFPGTLCGSLWSFTIPDANMNLLPCDKTRSDVAYSHCSSMPRAYMWIFGGDEGILALCSL